MITSSAAEERTASSTNPVALSNAVMKQPVTSDSGNDVKKTATEKKTADDGDDPFGALDWKDGIATLPGNTFFRCIVTPSKIAGFQCHATQNKSKSQPFNKLSPESGTGKKVNMQRLSPRFRSQQFFLSKICEEVFYPNL